MVSALMRYPSMLLIETHGAAIHRVRWEVEGDDADWKRIQAEGWFGVRPEVLGPVFGGELDPTLTHIFTLELGRAFLQPLAILADDHEDLVGILRGLDPDAPERSTSAWRLLSVMQPHSDRVQVGLTTTYFDQAH